MESQEQRLFNLAWVGLKAQGFRKSKIAATCRYRGENRMRCAIGWAIPDGKYSADIEGEGVSQFAEPGTGLVDIPGFGRVSRHFADNLQSAHDWAHGEGGMNSRLRELAAEYNLTIPEGV